MSEIIISCDSSCDLSKELIERYNIKVSPFSVLLGDKQYHDGVDITPDDIYEYHKKTGNLARTAAINMQESLEFFNSVRTDDTPIIFITISQKMSGTYQYASLAAKELKNVFVVDGENLSTGGGHLVIKAAELAKSGKTPEEIVEILNETKKRVNASFVIDSLEYLRKGGRCSTLAALGANLLKLKPYIEVRHGEMSVGKKYRGNFANVLKEYTAAVLADKDNIELDRVFITHAGADEKLVNDIAEQVKNTLPFKEVLITRAGATVSVHCGANTLGVLFIQKTAL